ncbi:NAC family transcription factor [Streptomyces anulatus]|uniref:hypothetical protein n=1 Tax=Streptomyces anulatus TaxID=1892 RepID=UPI0036DEAFDD
MGTERNKDEHVSRNEISNYLKGEANGPVFQSNRIGDVNINSLPPEELLEWYKQDHERLTAEKSSKLARQEELERRWDALTEKHVKIKNRLALALACFALPYPSAVISATVSHTVVDDILWATTWAIVAVKAALVGNLSKNRKRMERHQERFLI